MSGINYQTKTVLVLGSTGKTGSRVARRLIQRGWPVQLGSRKSNVPFHWENSATWPPVLQNMYAVYISYQPDLAMAGTAATIAAFASMAVASGVQKLVLLSGRGEAEAQQCEQAIMQSGASWTIVRASSFMQNFSETHLLESILGGYVLLPIGDISEPFIDADDIADVAVAALTNQLPSNMVYEVTGPQLLTFKEAIHAIAKARGRQIYYEQITIEQYTALLELHGVSNEIIALLRHLFTEVLDGRNAYVTNDVKKALGRKPVDFASFVKKNAAQGIWGRQPHAFFK
jgi:uncharacterized protein YbjT (DUF2867 family)